MLKKQSVLPLTEEIFLNDPVTDDKRTNGRTCEPQINEFDQVYRSVDEQTNARTHERTNGRTDERTVLGRPGRCSLNNEKIQGARFY